MKVQVISREAIKPSTPTPPHLRSMPLSMLDQLAPSIYIHLLLFYSAGGGAAEKAAHLKSSLSVALTHFYPFAGRIRGALTSSGAHVECNDEGAEFYEARVEGADLAAAVLCHPPMEELHYLLPNGGAEGDACDGRAPLLAVQFNRFACGGSAVGVAVSHVVADGWSMAMFLSGWADAACGRSVRRQPRFHAASVFPPADWTAKRGPPFSAACSAAGVVPKRFVIRGPEVEKLRRGEAYAAGRSIRPTRVEAVSALVWRCASRAGGGGPQVALYAVNLRKKTGEKLDEGSFGNLWTDAVVLWEGEDADEPTRCDAQGRLEKKVRDAVEEVDEGYARAAMAGGVALPEMSWEGEMGCWVFSSWCRFPLYETDLGWGRPAWACCALRGMKNVVILMDAGGEGGGVEVWLWLGEEEMGRFERDPEVVELFPDIVERSVTPTHY